MLFFLVACAKESNEPAQTNSKASSEYFKLLGNSIKDKIHSNKIGVLGLEQWVFYDTGTSCDADILVTGSATAGTAVVSNAECDGVAGSYNYTISSSGTITVCSSTCESFAKDPGLPY